MGRNRKIMGRCGLSRGIPILFLVIVAVLFLESECAAATWRIQRLGGRDYVPLSQVAQFYGMRLMPRGERGMVLISEGRIMEFTGGSREARIDRVKHWLSFPPLYFAGTMYISRMDLSKTIDPLMRPQRIPQLQPFRTVVLDPGHGGHDRGAVNRSGSEKNYNLDIARRVRVYLKAAGLRVLITRKGDNFIPLEGRPAAATRLQREDPGTIFVSIHCNDSGQRFSPATGLEVYSLTPRGAPNSNDNFLERRNFSNELGHTKDHASHTLATAIQHSMLGHVTMMDRGVKRARFAVLRRATTPAVLVECGFLSNPRDARLLNSVEWREQLAKAIAGGIIEFAKLSSTKKTPRLLANYLAERRQEGVVGDHGLLAGISANFYTGLGALVGWRSLLAAPLNEEMPPFRLEFNPPGWVQLEAIAAREEDARAEDHGSGTSMQQSEWPDPLPPFPGLTGWRGVVPLRNVEKGFELFPSDRGPVIGETW